MKKIISFCFFSFFFLFFPISAPLCQETNPPLPTNNSFLEEGIKQYQAENYEEAIEILEKARAQDPQSSMAAFFLGMAYKQTINYDKAAVNLEASLKLKPAVKEALVEYVDILYHSNKLAEAKKWIKIAQEQNIAPANIAFLEGMILAQERKYTAAIEAFEKAKLLDKNLAQTADYQIGLCYMNARKYKNAQERFKATASYDPKSDLAGYARQYLEAVENSLFYTRPLRVTLGLSAGYDSNVVSKPPYDSLAGGIGDPGSGIFSPSLRIEYVPRLESSWLFNAMYTSSATLNQNYVHSRDSLVNTLSVIPGYNFGRYSISILGSYTGYLLRTDSDVSPDGNAGYKRYENYYTGGPIIKIMLTESQILEVFAGYDKKNYFNQVITSNDSIRDSDGPRAYLSWMWFYRNNGFLNLRYEVAEENADGSYWDNTTNRWAANLVLPMLSDNLAQKIGFMYLQLAGSYTVQNYSYPQPYSEVDRSVKSGCRKDRIYTASAGLNWDITKNWSCILQYTHIKSDSNIPVYEYTRNLYNIGLEFKF
ncbi:MAG: tetratricopeptide repeat protein [Smithella sp.]